MNKEKYVYNPDTLSYDRVSTPMRTKVLRIVAVASGVGVFAVISALIGSYIFPSAQERALQQELKQKNFQIEMVGEKVKDMEEYLDKLHTRDNQVYRMVFGANPVDENVWNAGKGGTDKYAHLQGLSDKELLVNTLSKVDHLQSKIAVQSKSLDEITNLAKEKDQMLASIPSIRPVNDLQRDLTLLSGFGYRIHPIHKIAKMHTGIDFPAPIGTPIYATGDGVISEATDAGSGYGQHIVIDHGFGYKTLYAHMSVMKGRIGQKVKRGELIGLVGNTGSSTGPHCHYEVILKDEKINPIHYCQDDLDPETYSKLVGNSAVSNQSFD